MLEDVAVGNSDILMAGLKLVDRQMPAGNGALDLLGMDANGRLMLIELKRDKITRNAWLRPSTTVRIWNPCRMTNWRTGSQNSRERVTESPGSTISSCGIKTTSTERIRNP